VPHVDVVTPTVHFNAIISRTPKLTHREADTAVKLGVPGRGPKTTGIVTETFNTLEKCDQEITPFCLRALYGVAYTPLASKQNSFAICQQFRKPILKILVLTVSYSQPNSLHKLTLPPISTTLQRLSLQTFMANAPNSCQSMAVSFVAIVICSTIDAVLCILGFIQTNQTGFGFNAESNLDLQYAMALVTAAQAVTLYQVGDISSSQLCYYRGVNHVDKSLYHRLEFQHHA
jgi:tripeptidyl-peptidase I